METVKILHCGDIHIGAEESFLGFKAQSRRQETLLTFERIVNLCSKTGTKVLLIAGDLFNSNNTENSFFESVFAKIKSVPELKVIYCAGNHDPLTPRSPFRKENLPSNLYVLGTDETVFSFPELNLRVYGRSFETAFMQGETSMKLLPEDDGVINIALLHGDLFGDPSSRYNAISRSFIENSKMDYIALGHIHKASDIKKIGDTYFAYCGCPEGQGFDELGQKGVYIGEIGKGICDLKFVPTARRQHILEKINISGLEISHDIILNILSEKYGENYSENLYKIELIGETEEGNEINISDLTARLNEKVYFAKLKDSTTLKLDLESLSKEKTLKGIFVKKMLEKIALQEEKEKYETALKLGLKAFSGEVKFDENQ